LLSSNSTLAVVGVTVFFSIALATVVVGTLISVGNAQVIGLNRTLATASPGRPSLFDSKKLRHNSKPGLVSELESRILHQRPI